MSDAERFVVAATSGRRDRAEAMLGMRLEIERDRWALLVLGRGWDGDPNEVGGPRTWTPLHYVCHSCFASVDLARELLRLGANPNAFFADEEQAVSATTTAITPTDAATSLSRLIYLTIPRRRLGHAASRLPLVESGHRG